ncbi:MAG: exonuclease SbcC [Nitrosopumilus sp.]|nr:exonuclease SbcC [Nitrosopumilus sp.]
MVFGWGKKKGESISEEITTQKEISLSEVENITRDLLNLRTTQTLSAVKSFRNKTSPLIKELASIANSLEKDNLKVDEIDKHLRTIVVRGKKQVIDVIKKDHDDLPEISTLDDMTNLDNVLNQKLKKIGDVLGRQTRVIHIFAKKYAEKLKEILAEMNYNHSEIKKLIKNFQGSKSSSNEITVLLSKIKIFKDDSIFKNKQISESQILLDSSLSKIKTIEDSIDKIKSGEKYTKFLKLKQDLSSFNETKNQIKHEIDSQFTKISRALSRYEYASSLDREQKSLLSQLINEPIEAMERKNKDNIIIIFESVKKGIISGSISVKDVEKSISYITETEELLAQFVKKVNNFEEQKKEIQYQLLEFEDPKVSLLEKDLKKTLNQKQDIEFKISSYRKDIEENSANTPKIISEIEDNLKIFSNTDYTIVQST